MSGKIKLRNLDPEVLDKINHGGGSGGTNYDDAELRARIESLEEKSVTKTDLEENYAKKTEVVSGSSVDTRIEALKSEMTSTYGEDIKLIQENGITKTNDVIDETYLSPEVREKLNNTYTLNIDELRKEFASVEQINKLENDIIETSVDIDNITRSVSNDYVQKTDRIDDANLTDELRNKIDNARPKNTKISFLDLDAELQTTITEKNVNDDPAIVKSKEEFDNFVDNFKDKTTGEVFYAIHNNDLGTDNIGAHYIFSDRAIVIASSSLLKEAEEWAGTSNKDYVVDLENNAVYLFVTESSSWKREKEVTAVGFMAGIMAAEFRTNDIYFGVSTEKCRKIMINRPTIKYGTTDLPVGSPLETGSLYVVYEE